MYVCMCVCMCVFVQTFTSFSLLKFGRDYLNGALGDDQLQVTCDM